MEPARDASKPSADLTRLRIPRGSQDVGRVRGLNPLWWVLLLGLGGAAYLFRDALWAQVGPGGAAGPTLRTARVERVVPGQARETDVVANGYVVADRSASLASVISGRLVELNYKEDDIVEKDAVVARVQYDDLEALAQEAKTRTTAAEAQVEQALRSIEAAEMDVPRLEAERATLDRLVSEARETTERLEREVVRNRPLVPSVISADALDRLEGQARAARRSLEAAESRVAVNVAALEAWSGEISRRRAELAVAAAQVEVARQVEVTAAIQVEKTKIRAPFRGLVVRKDAEKGEVIAPTGGGQNSKGSVLTIVDPESLEMQVEVNERRIGRVKAGDAARVKLDADDSRDWPGTVRKIWPRADRSKGTIEVRVAFIERPPGAKPDMAGQVTFTGAAVPGAPVEEPYLALPEAALARRANTDVVFVLEGGVVRQVAVVLGGARGGSLVVRSGLSGGEVVVLSPSAALTDGQRVGPTP